MKFNLGKAVTPQAFSTIEIEDIVIVNLKDKTVRATIAGADRRVDSSVVGSLPDDVIESIAGVVGNVAGAQLGTTAEAEAEAVEP